VNVNEYAAATQKFQPNALTLGSTTHWRVLLRVKQITLGSLVLLPVEPVADFDEVTADVAVDFFRAITCSQSALKQVFEPDRYNVIAAMMKDAFVHFHLIPRYSTERELAGATWADPDWPQLIAFRDVDTDDATRKSLLETLTPAFGENL
jgi:diadenosine tetraphosphate (Ap4A) HIT family hydrolase